MSEERRQPRDVDEKSRKDADDEEQKKDAQILLHRTVDAEQDEQSDAALPGPVDQTGDPVEVGVEVTPEVGGDRADADHAHGAQDSVGAGRPPSVG